ncbi:hypothetical protein BKK79_10920 [Cupriavidus sp. USMAA2-4]|uniref:hypothetical protein n=1 Tax=Cupriavidus sp. USMAA2-4 TaxID=876364 RepID=UPI0008A6FEF6|nr:hypothetical protein [Cupriavidus sp. USMAA2-4]AOY92231.1 hypothetical protein BKK79_10920 [Cupriavidus sp. USMAA2-4]
MSDDNKGTPNDGVEEKARPAKGITWEQLGEGSLDDLSGSGILPEDVSGLLSEQIKDRKQFRHFRYVAFYGVAMLVIGAVAALIAWTWCVGRHVAESSSTATYQASLFITPLIVLASFAALLVLALLRFAFRSLDSKEKDDSPDALGVVHALGREALAVLKDYLGKKVG